MRHETAQTAGCPPEPRAETAAPGLSARPDLLACKHCDALYRQVDLDSSQQARCVRCGNLVGRGHRMSRQGIAALTVAAAVTFLVAHTQPVAHLDFGGVRSTTTLPRALWDTWAAGEPATALLAAAVTLVFPLLVLLLRLYVLLPMVRRERPPYWQQALRALHWASRWSMVEVLMLSAMVAIVRLAAMASVRPDVGLVAFGALAILLAALDTAGFHRLWALADPDEEANG